MQRSMRTLFIGAACLGGAFQGAGRAAPDLLPVSLTVALADSTKSPEEDSVTITLQFAVRTSPTKTQGEWIAAQIHVDGALRMNGGVDSNQALAANTQYTYRIGSWVEKKPFSIIAYVDPYGVSGEPAADGLNNLMIKKYNFHPGVRKDTVYTGKNCVAAGGTP